MNHGEFLVNVTNLNTQSYLYLISLLVKPSPVKQLNLEVNTIKIYFMIHEVKNLQLRFDHGIPP